MSSNLLCMLSPVLKRSQTAKKSGSTVMFQGNFKAEVQRSIHELETFLEKELRSVYDDIYVESGRNNVKVRVIVRSE